VATNGTIVVTVTAQYGDFVMLDGSSNIVTNALMTNATATAVFTPQTVSPTVALTMQTATVNALTNAVLTIQRIP
jgi:hypothetical protein